MSLEDGYFDDYSGQWVDGGVPSGGGELDFSGIAGSGIGDYYSNAGYEPSSWWSSAFPTSYDNQTNTGNTGSMSLGGLGSLLGGAANSSNSQGTDYSRLLGTLGAAGLGAYGANQSAEAYERLANQYMGMGAPYRERLAASYANPEAYLTSPEVTASVDQGTNALARALSVKGNPAGNATALQGLQSYATNSLYGQLGNERQRLANFGGLSQLTGGAPSAAMAGINAGQGVYDAAGWGLNKTFNPQPTMADLIRQLQGGSGLA